MKRNALLSLIALMIVLMLPSCALTNKDIENAMKKESLGHEAYYLKDELFIVNLNNSKDLLKINIRDETPLIPGNVYTIELDDDISKSFPPQTGAETAKDMGSGAGYIIDTDLAKSIFETLGNSVALVDVRTPKEYENRHMESSVNIPLQEIKKIKDVVPGDKIVIVYCRSGNRSAQSVPKLIDMGYTAILDAGGLK